MNYEIIFYKLTGGRLYDSDTRDITHSGGVGLHLTKEIE